MTKLPIYSFVFTMWQKYWFYCEKEKKLPYFLTEVQYSGIVDNTYTVYMYRYLSIFILTCGLFHEWNNNWKLKVHVILIPQKYWVWYLGKYCLNDAIVNWCWNQLLFMSKKILQEHPKVCDKKVHILINSLCVTY